MTQRFANGTWLQDESAAYPAGGQTRKGMAMFRDGKVRAVRAGIPDTYSTIPAHATVNGKYVGGFLTAEDKYDGNDVVLRFNYFTGNPDRRPPGATRWADADPNSANPWERRAGRWMFT